MPAQHFPVVQLRPAQHSGFALQAKPLAPQQLPCVLQCRPVSQSLPAQHPSAAPPQPAFGSAMSAVLVVPPSFFFVEETGGGATHAPSMLSRRTAKIPACEMNMS